jgi:hypothetical protein
VLISNDFILVPPISHEDSRNANGTELDQKNDTSVLEKIGDADKLSDFDKIDNKKDDNSMKVPMEEKIEEEKETKKQKILETVKQEQVKENHKNKIKEAIDISGKYKRNMNTNVKSGNIRLIDKELPTGRSSFSSSFDEQFKIYLIAGVVVVAFISWIVRKCTQYGNKKE